VDLTNRRNEFCREKINEVVFPKLKFLIRKGVPLKQMRQFILNVFAIANLDTQMDYQLSLKQVSHALEELISNAPTFGQKVKLEKLLVHHCLSSAGMRVDLM
jgi:hypothetical protein